MYTIRFPRAEGFLTRLCRSSDSFQRHRLPVGLRMTPDLTVARDWCAPVLQLERFTSEYFQLTAAGLFGTFTRFPFHPIPERGNRNKTGANIRTISEMIQEMCLFSHSLKQRRRAGQPSCKGRGYLLSISTIYWPKVWIRKWSPHRHQLRGWYG